MAYVTPVGFAGFSRVKEAAGFKGSDENKRFSQGLVLSIDEGPVFIDKLQEMYNKLHAKEIETQKARGRSVRYALPVVNYKELNDGSFSIDFKRREEEGAPPVIDADGKPYTGLIKREHKIQVAYDLKPYVMGATFGVALKLLAVKVVETQVSVDDVASIFGISKSTKKTAPAKPVDVKDLF